MKYFTFKNYVKNNKEKESLIFETKSNVIEVHKQWCFPKKYVILNFFPQFIIRFSLLFFQNFY